MKLTEEQIAQELGQLSDWKRDDEKWISRKYRFSAFLDGIAFVNAVAAFAEHQNHHPMIAIDYKLITLRLTSWRAGGLTRLDFDAAREYDRIFDNL